MCVLTLNPSKAAPVCLTQRIRRKKKSHSHRLSFPKSIGHAAGIIDTPIWSQERHSGPARLHSALCEERQEALYLFEPESEQEHKSLLIVFCYDSVAETPRHLFGESTFPSWPSCYVCGVAGWQGPVGDREMSGRQCTKDTGVLWFCYRVREEAWLISASVSCIVSGAMASVFVFMLGYGFKVPHNWSYWSWSVPSLGTAM